MADKDATKADDGGDASSDVGARTSTLRAQIISYLAAQEESKVADDQASAAKAKLDAIKPALRTALHDLLHHIATHDVPDGTRSGVDDELVSNAVALKWPLVRGLQDPHLARSYLGLPRTMEQTRIYLAGITTAKAREVLEVELVRNIDSCDRPEELRCSREVLVFLTGAGRYKKDLGGIDLPKDTKRSCRTAINKVEKAEKVLASEAQKQRQQQAQKVKKNTSPVFIDRDVREQDKEREEARVNSCSLYIEEALSVGDKNAHK